MGGLVGNLNGPGLLPILSTLILKENAASRFPVNSTMFFILAKLGIEKWNEKLNYSGYYQNCNPATCSYTLTKNFNIPIVITTVIGLVGGLSVILRILVPLFIKLFRRHRRLQITITNTAKLSFTGNSILFNFIWGISTLSIRHRLFYKEVWSV